MKRTQIQLDEETYEALRLRAFQEKQSFASIVRSSLREQILAAPRKVKRPLRTFSFIASGRSQGKGSGKISENHDSELARAINHDFS
jgi:plasmid stability protein